MALLRTTIALMALAAVGCLGTSPQEREPAVQGDYDDGDEEHRPGQPCLLCHGDGHLIRPPGETSFVIAGTVYGGISDDEDLGLEFVDVTITDANGMIMSVSTNRTGNFMIEVDGSDPPLDRGRGRLAIASDPVFPLSVEIARGSDEQTMKTQIWREGSCAHCHGPTPTESSVGRVYLFPPEAP